MIVNVDAAGLEWRTAVTLAGEDTAISEILNGEDTHAKNQETFGLPSRLISKIYLFRTIFRGSGWSFAHDPNFSHVSDSPKYWDNINKMFYEKYKKLDELHETWYKTVAEGRPIIGPTGREWMFKPTTNYRGEYALPITNIVNYPVQGTGADIVALARVSTHQRFKRLRMASRLVQTVHDSIVADCPEDEYKAASRIFYEVFDDIPKMFKSVFNYELPIPFPGEVKIGYNLAEMTEIKQEEL